MAARDFRPGDVVRPARRGYGRATHLHPGGLQLEAGKPIKILAVLGGGWVEVLDAHGRMCEVHEAFLAAPERPPVAVTDHPGLFQHDLGGEG